jgi:hypothetical protein
MSAPEERPATTTDAGISIALRNRQDGVVY